MASEVLVDADIDRGRRVLEALDSTGLRARAAFWRYAHESSDWRLVIALPTVDLRGTRSVYERLGRLLKKSDIDIPLWRITVVSTGDPLTRWARLQIKKTDPEVVGLRSSSNTAIGDAAIEDAYIYRSTST